MRVITSVYYYNKSVYRVDASVYRVETLVCRADAPVSKVNTLVLRVDISVCIVDTSVYMVDTSDCIVFKLFYINEIELLRVSWVVDVCPTTVVYNKERLAYKIEILSIFVLIFVKSASICDYKAIY